MPVPFDQLIAKLTGDQRSPNPFEPNVPPLTLRDVPSSGSEGLASRFPLLPAGDVVPFPKPKGPFQGPTPESSDYMLGKKTQPGVIPISPDQQFWQDWMNRAINRPLGG